MRIKLVVALVTPALLGAQKPPAAQNADWPVFGGTTDNTHYSTLSQITPRNVATLQVVTANSLLFIGATTYDRKFRAFDKMTGELLWETTLPASGNATPALYMVNGREYLVIACGGGKNGAESGGTYVAFALPGRP